MTRYSHFHFSQQSLIFYASFCYNSPWYSLFKKHSDFVTYQSAVQKGPACSSWAIILSKCATWCLQICKSLLFCYRASKVTNGSGSQYITEKGVLTTPWVVKAEPLFITFPTRSSGLCMLECMNAEYYNFAEKAKCTQNRSRPVTGIKVKISRTVMYSLTFP